MLKLLAKSNFWMRLRIKKFDFTGGVGAVGTHNLNIPLLIFIFLRSKKIEI